MLDHQRKKSSLHIWQPEEELVTQVPFLFNNNFHKKTGSKIKMKSEFLRIFDNLFQNILLTKEFLECRGYISGYLPKVSRDLEPVLVPIFNIFSIFLLLYFENFPYIILDPLEQAPKNCKPKRYFIFLFVLVTVTK